MLAVIVIAVVPEAAGGEAKVMGSGVGGAVSAPGQAPNVQPLFPETSVELAAYQVELVGLATIFCRRRNWPQTVPPPLFTKLAVEVDIVELTEIGLADDVATALKVERVVVVSEVNLTFFGGFIVRVLKVLLPENMTAPAPPPAMVIL